MDLDWHWCTPRWRFPSYNSQTHPPFIFISFMFILLAMILKCDTDRYTEFNQRLNVEAYPLTTAYLEVCLPQADTWFGFILFACLDSETNEKRIICTILYSFSPRCMLMNVYNIAQQVQKSTLTKLHRIKGNYSNKGHLFLCSSYICLDRCYISASAGNSCKTGGIELEFSQYQFITVLNLKNSLDPHEKLTDR